MRTTRITFALLVAAFTLGPICIAQTESVVDASTSTGRAELSAGIAGSNRGIGPTFGLSLGTGIHAVVGEYRRLAKAPGIPYQVSLDEETFTECALLYRIQLGDEDVRFQASAGAALVLEKRLGKFLKSSTRTESSSRRFLWWNYTTSASYREDDYEVDSHKNFGAVLDIGLTIRMWHWCSLGAGLHFTGTPDRSALSGNLAVILGDFR
jgi:hypothetical protein